MEMKDSASSLKKTTPSSFLLLHMGTKFFPSLKDCIRNILQRFPSLIEEAQYKNRKYDIFEKMKVKTILINNPN